MGEWVEFRQVKKFAEGTIKSGTILDLKTHTNGMPWENERIFLTMYSYLPDFKKMRYYAESIALGDNKYQIICRLVGYDYTTSVTLPNINIAPNTEWIILYTGKFYGVTYSYNNMGTLATEGHKAFANGIQFVDKVGTPYQKLLGYQGSYFTDTEQNGSIRVQQIGNNYGGQFQNITIFTQPAEIKELLVNFIAIEE